MYVGLKAIIMYTHLQRYVHQNIDIRATTKKEYN